jgi:hypothetical protein
MRSGSAAQKSSWRACVLCALLPFFAGAHAQALEDPMRPSGTSSGVEGTSAASRAPGSLQGVLTSPTRKLALIDGQVVPLGNAVRDGTLSGLSDGSAVVKKNDERDVLLMHPNIDKRPARRPEGQ